MIIYKHDHINKNNGSYEFYPLPSPLHPDFDQPHHLPPPPLRFSNT